MKRMILLILLNLFLIGTTYSDVSSKVKGKIIDEITKQPVSGAKVKLVLAIGRESLQRFLDWDTIISDERGEFCFDIPTKIASMYGRAYYLQVEKKGYIKYHPDYYRRYIKKRFIAKIFNYFKVGEGQIKYMVLKLKKGGAIRGVLKKKIGDKISPLQATCSIRAKNKLHEFFEDIKMSYSVRGFDVDKNGMFEINDLEPADDYIIKISPNNYVRREIKNISVKKNEITNIDYIFDQTNRTGIKGTITWKNTAVNESATILMLKKDGLPYSGGMFETDKIGNFEYCGVLPGTYRITVYYRELKDNLPHVFEKKVFIKILPDQTKTLNININENDD